MIKMSILPGHFPEFFQTIGLATAIASISYFLLRRRGPEPRIGGWVSPGFEPVKDVFEANFRSGWDSKGAAFTAIKDGAIVVNLHGGYANTETLQEWEEDTLVNIFSCGKGVVSIAVAMLVDR